MTIVSVPSGTSTAVLNFSPHAVVSTLAHACHGCNGLDAADSGFPHRAWHRLAKEARSSAAVRAHAVVALPALDTCCSLKVLALLDNCLAYLFLDNAAIRHRRRRRHRRQPAVSGRNCGFRQRRPAFPAAGAGLVVVGRSGAGHPAPGL